MDQNYQVLCARFHDICAGHRVYGHEGKCKNLHGHNYRIHFTCQAEKLDSVGRIIDFSVMKEELCDWLEENWDHKMLIWEDDPILSDLTILDFTVVAVPFNPTAENMAKFLLGHLGKMLLKNTGIKLIEVKVEETRKCFATARLEK